MGNEIDGKKQLKVLHVEDSPRDAEIIRERLIDAGFFMQIDWAADEKEFSTFLRCGQYDIILADYQLPGFDAPAALKLAQTFCPGVPFICVSGAVGEDKAVDLLKQGATDYVSKERLGKLPLAVQRALGEVEARAARRLAEEALRESKALMDAIVENVPNMIFLKEAQDLRFVVFNRAGEELLGYGREFLLGKNNLDLFPPEQAAHFLAKDREVLDGEMGILDIQEEPILTANQGLRLLHTKKVCIRGEDGITKYLLGISEDITERRQAEEEQKKLQIQLLQAQKMEAIGTLAGGIAHDFNNILGAILGYAEMAQEDSPAGSMLRKDIDQVVNASHRAKDLVKQILAFSRQAATDHIPLQPGIIIKEALKMLRSSLPTTIAIQQDIDSEAGLIFADPTQIHQVMVNLCTNAFHAMEETGGTLTILLKKTTLSTADLANEPRVQPGDFVQLSISDTGPGIAPEIQEKMFDPYFTTKEVGKGTGMGLAIIHGIAKSYKGFVTCRSQLGEGTVFHVYLPIIQDPVVLETEPAPLDLTQLGNERILFIDDEEILAEMCKNMLERLGYHVTVRASSLEALTTFQNQPDKFDLIITDQTMPGMTGSDLARRILQIRPGMPIILCTGYSSLITEGKAKSFGIKGFAMKPLTRKSIAVLIREVLDGGRLLSLNPSQ